MKTKEEIQTEMEIIYYKLTLTRDIIKKERNPFKLIELINQESTLQQLLDKLFWIIEDEVNTLNE